MIWTPSPRPPWSERLMSLTLRDAAAVMARLYPVLPVLALSPRRRRDRVESQAPGLLADLGHGDGSDGEEHGDARHDVAQPITLQDRDDIEGGGGADPAAALREAETRGAGVGREHLRGEDLHRVAGKLDEEIHAEPDHQNHRVRFRVVEGDGEQRRQHEGSEGGADAPELLERV